MPGSLRAGLTCTLALVCGAVEGGAAEPRPRLLLSAEDAAAHRQPGPEVREFDQALSETAQRLRAYFTPFPDVPVPRDGGGGYTHERHKQNGMALQDAGLLYRWTEDADYARWAGRLLLEYAERYPTLGEHPQKKEQAPGRLFWQNLNESVWLVSAIQGYDAIYDFLSAGERSRIESALLRPMADFLSVGSPRTFDRIHNHGVWAAAAVGMTGYVLDAPDLVDRALFGLGGEGETGFLRQMNRLFSPDGYYTEGPYYQRYALMPFVLFARAIDRNEPARRIFERRDGVLLKAIAATIQLSYAGRFFPFNDAIKDKGLNTVELGHGATIAYRKTSDPRYLSVLDHISSIPLTGDGFRAMSARAEGLARPFEFRSMKLRDGPEGDRGAVAVLRDRSRGNDSAVVFKAASQGMGHGHFDRLAWLYYDNGNEVVRDYGSARFLNVPQKAGGRYLPENQSWAKQTVAHNTLVVDERSQFGGQFQQAADHAPQILFYDDSTEVQVVSARDRTAYPGVSLTRTLVSIGGRVFERPVVLDVFRAAGSRDHTYDLPLWFNGHVVSVNRRLSVRTDRWEPWGDRDGYQHLWLVANGSAKAGEPLQWTWLLGNRFYTYTAVADRDLEIRVARIGANDPDFNLRTEQGLVLRTQADRTVTYVGLIEPHGEYNASLEQTLGETSDVARLTRLSQQGRDLIEIVRTGGQVFRIALSYDPDEGRRHCISTPSGSFEWIGFYGVFESREEADAVADCGSETSSTEALP
ncbi:MAG: alginate lyase family protein [Proteobacteria bacterium]|nr:alginate lyase family protein [Pseudomonadota bacterium]